MPRTEGEILAAIVAAHQKRANLERKFKDSATAKLNEPKELLRELEEKIEGAENVKDQEAPERLRSIVSTLGDLKERRSKTYDKWKGAKERYEKAEKVFNELIENADQMELQLEE